MALANIFGGGSGWRLATTSDPFEAGLISRVAAAGEELIDEVVTSLAREIRNQIVDAWNKGQG